MLSYSLSHSQQLTRQGKIALRAGRANARLCLRRYRFWMDMSFLFRIFAITASTLSIHCYATDSFKISEIRDYFSRNGLEATIGLVHGVDSVSEFKKLRIDDVMTGMAGDSKVEVDWWSKPFPEKSKLRISTSTEQAYIDEPPLTADSEGAHSCFGSASSDTLIYSMAASRYFAFSWSCGSGGCSFWVDFIEKEEDLDKLCRDG